MEPLAVALVWNKSDEKKVKKYIDHFTNMLSSDIEKPFSRNIRLPIFYYKNESNDSVPPDIILKAEKKIIYAFISYKCVASEEWELYIKKLFALKDCKVVGIALDKEALYLSNQSNFIREYDYKDFSEKMLYISMTHEMYRYCFSYENGELSTDKALKIFLSHTKNDDYGLILAQKLKNTIDNTTLKRFFDVNDIAPSYNFGEEIENNIKKSSQLLP